MHCACRLSRSLHVGGAPYTLFSPILFLPLRIVRLGRYVSMTSLFVRNDQRMWLSLQCCHSLFFPLKLAINRVMWLKFVDKYCLLENLFLSFLKCCMMRVISVVIILSIINQNFLPSQDCLLGTWMLRDHLQIIRSKSETIRNGFSVLFDFKIHSTIWNDLSVTETFLRVNEYP
jgi:hypothetical protein